MREKVDVRDGVKLTVADKEDDREALGDTDGVREGDPVALGERLLLGDAELVRDKLTDTVVEGEVEVEADTEYVALGDLEAEKLMRVLGGGGRGAGGE